MKLLKVPNSDFVQNVKTLGLDIYLRKHVYNYCKLITIKESNIDFVYNMALNFIDSEKISQSRNLISKEV